MGDKGKGLTGNDLSELDWETALPAKRESRESRGRPWEGVEASCVGLKAVLGLFWLSVACFGDLPALENARISQGKRRFFCGSRLLRESWV